MFAGYTLVILAGDTVRNNSLSITCALTVMLIFVVGAANRLHTLLNWRWLQGLGVLSHSIYFIHNPNTGATFRVGTMLGANSVASNALWRALSIASCIAAVWLMLALVERPSTRLARKIASRAK